MSCSSCKYLKEDKRCEGRVSGACYYCSKINSYVNGANTACEKYEKSYSRNTYTCNSIYEDGEKYYNDATPISFYLFILIIMIILALIVNL